MANISEIAAQLKEALETSERSHKALEDAQAKLLPLETAAKEADNAVHNLMIRYQQATSDGAPVVRRRGPGGAGKKRGPRSTEAIVMTSASRLLGELRKDGKTKKAAALEAAVLKGTELAKNRGGLTPELRLQIEAKAEALWARK